MIVVIELPGIAVIWAMGADQVHAVSGVFVALVSVATTCFACLGVGVAWRGRGASRGLARVVILLLSVSLGLLFYLMIEAMVRGIPMVLPLVLTVGGAVGFIARAVHRAAA